MSKQKNKKPKKLIRAWVRNEIDGNLASAWVMLNSRFDRLNDIITATKSITADIGRNVANLQRDVLAIQEEQASFGEWADRTVDITNIHAVTITDIAVAVNKLIAAHNVMAVNEGVEITPVALHNVDGSTVPPETAKLAQERQATLSGLVEGLVEGLFTEGSTNIGPDGEHDSSNCHLCKALGVETLGQSGGDVDGPKAQPEPQEAPEPLPQDEQVAEAVTRTRARTRRAPATPKAPAKAPARRTRKS